MIRIKRDDFPQIAQKFTDELRKYLTHKTTKKCLIGNSIEKAISDNHQRYAAMMRFYKDNFDVIGKIRSVEGLWKINNEFERKFSEEIEIWRETSDKKEKPKTEFGLFVKKMAGIYNGLMVGDKLGKNIGMWLSKMLNVTTCPYCNRHYTFSIDKNDNHIAIRPQFDHFLPKSRYPITAVCFYNLVPACAECNKTKGEELIGIHPYEKSFDDDDIFFRVEMPYSHKSKLSLTNSTGNANVDKLALMDLYRMHIDIVMDLINKAEAYNPVYYEELLTTYKSLGLTRSEIERCVWGTSLSSEDYSLRPLSKLTADILRHLGIS